MKTGNTVTEEVKDYPPYLDCPKPDSDEVRYSKMSDDGLCKELNKMEWSTLISFYNGRLFGDSLIYKKWCKCMEGLIKKNNNTLLYEDINKQGE